MLNIAIRRFENESDLHGVTIFAAAVRVVGSVALADDDLGRLISIVAFDGKASGRIEVTSSGRIEVTSNAD